MRYFEPLDRRRGSGHLPDARLRLGLALVLGRTIFGSQWAMADEEPKWAAIVVTVGLAISVVPILVRGLPPLTRDAQTNERDPDYWTTVAALAGYVTIVALVLVVPEID
jgi:hypothetical protein